MPRRDSATRRKISAVCCAPSCRSPAPWRSRTPARPAEVPPTRIERPCPGQKTYSATGCIVRLRRERIPCYQRPLAEANAAAIPACAWHGNFRSRIAYHINSAPIREKAAHKREAYSMAGKTTMAFGEAVRIAGGSLWSHKLRSVLTLLGVVIGVMSVIAVVSFVNGLNRYVAEKVFAVGADLNHPNAQVKTATDYLSNADVLGWSGEMPQLYSYDLMAGRQINQADVLHAHPVCSVGYDIADKLFPGVDPIGKRVRVDTAECEIIGAGKKLGSVMGQSRDNWVVIPITFFQQVYGSDDSVRIWVKAHSAAAKAMQTTMDEV